jgi:hypothetical protein
MVRKTFLRSPEILPSVHQTGPMVSSLLKRSKQSKQSKQWIRVDFVCLLALLSCANASEEAPLANDSVTLIKASVEEHHGTDLYLLVPCFTCHKLLLEVSTRKIFIHHSFYTTFPETMLHNKGPIGPVGLIGPDGAVRFLNKTPTCFTVYMRRFRNAY